MILVPKEFALHNAYPNPFNPTTTIKFALPEDVKMSIVAYDIQGREVATLINGNYASGYHQIQWNANNTFSSGLYFVRMIAGDYVHTQKVMLIK